MSHKGFQLDIPRGFHRGPAPGRHRSRLGPEHADTLTTAGNLVLFLADQGKDEEAKSDLLEAARRDQQNREVRKELDAVKVALSARDREDQKLFSKMLSPAAPAGTLV